MEYKRCPRCGSIYFVIHHNSHKGIYHIDENDQLIVIEDQSPYVNLPLGEREISCGACSWKGNVGELALPR